MLWNSFEVFLGYPVSNMDLNKKNNIKNLLEYKSISQNTIDSSIYFKNLKVFKKVISEKPIPNSFFLQMNDVLIKTTPPHQALIIDEINEFIVVPSSFIIVRGINNNSIMSKIELWSLINSEIFKKEIRRISQISFNRITSLSMKNIREIRINEGEILRNKRLATFFYKTERLKWEYKNLIILNDKRMKFYERRKI